MKFLKRLIFNKLLKKDFDETLCLLDKDDLSCFYGGNAFDEHSGSFTCELY